jgi:hypothetical protein
VPLHGPKVKDIMGYGMEDKAPLQLPQSSVST